MQRHVPGYVVVWVHDGYMYMGAYMGMYRGTYMGIFKGAEWPKLDNLRRAIKHSGYFRQFWQFWSIMANSVNSGNSGQFLSIRPIVPLFIRQSCPILPKIARSALCQNGQKQ